MVRRALNESETKNETNEKLSKTTRAKSDVKPRYMQPARRSALVTDVHINFLRKGDGIYVGRA